MQGEMELAEAFRLAAIERAGGRLSTAEKIYAQILVAEPNHPVALNNLGNILAESGRLEQAVDCYCRSLASLPGDPELLANLGIALKSLGRAQVSVPSAFKRPNGEPRFTLPIPYALINDAGAAFLVQHEVLFGGYEYSTRKFLDDHLLPGDAFVDVGAHWGVFSLTAATRWPGQVRVLSVEPHPDNLQILRQAMAHNNLENMVDVLPFAAGNSTGTLPLVLDSSMCHSLSRTGGQSIDVAVAPLDSLIDRLSSSRRILLKIDAEGYEPEVLRGARKLLQDGRVAAVIWEKGVYFDAEPGLSAMRGSLESLRSLGFTHWRFADENAGGPLLAFEANRERCNIFSLRGMDPLHSYEKPSGRNAPPVPKAES